MEGSLVLGMDGGSRAGAYSLDRPFLADVRTQVVFVEHLRIDTFHWKSSGSFRHLLFRCCLLHYLPARQVDFYEKFVSFQKRCHFLPYLRDLMPTKETQAFLAVLGCWHYPAGCVGSP